MKKLLLGLAVMCAALVSQAQITLSGTLGFSSDDYSYRRDGMQGYDASLPEGYTFTIAPAVGYRLTEELEAGVRLEGEYAPYVFTDGFYNPVSKAYEESQVEERTTTMLGGGAYLRYRAVSWGSFSLIAELSARYRKGGVRSCTTEYAASSGWPLEFRQREAQSQVDVMLTPILNYAITEHLSVDLNLNLMALGYHRLRSLKYGVEDSSGNADLLSVLTTDHYDLMFSSATNRGFGLGLGYVF